MVEPEVIIVPIVFGLPTLAVMFRTWVRHREKMATLSASPESSAKVEARLERVEQAVEAIAVEIERIGESQRFLTKVLTEARPALASGATDSTGGPFAPR